MKTVSHHDHESGMALVTTLMVLMLMSALMVGFFAAISTDQRANGIDRDQTQAYAAAHAGLEKLTSDLGTLFETNFAPTATQINALTATPPTISGFQYTAPTGGSGYAVTFVTDANGNPAPADPNGTVISAGPFQGFRGIITPYTITVTARSNGGGAEVRLRRQLETVSVPVFQFGIFSETDLSFFAGPNFNFGGRVQTNGNLYLAEGNGNTLTLADRVTSAGEVIRRELSNGYSNRDNVNYRGTVNAITAPGTFRALGLDEGSVQNAMGPPGGPPPPGGNSAYAYVQNEPTWTNLSVGTYKSNIRSSRTGGKRLNLPLVQFGAQPIDLIRRPAQNSNENVAQPLIYGQRYFGLASLRILLSDTAADITSLPTISAGAPLSLDTVEPYALDATHPPFAESAAQAATTTQGGTTAAGSATIDVNSLAGFNVGLPNHFFLNGNIPVYCTGTGPGFRFSGCSWTAPATIPGGATVDTGFRSPVNTGLNSGFIKIEKQDAAGVWTDVTLEILNLGIAGKNLFVGVNCPEPNPNAVIRIQRVRDRPSTAPTPTVANNCGNGSLVATDYWPNMLYDTREGNVRDANATTSTTMSLGGVIGYVELDVNNLRLWLTGVTGATGTQAVSNNGYIVYFSDRRNNRNAANQETAEYGFEDVVNPADVNGAANGVLDAGEDINATTTAGYVPVLDTYGQTPQNNAGFTLPLDNTARPWTTAGVTAAVARVNRPIFFRRALKLVNGQIQGAVNSVPSPGLTVAAENPVYVQGNYNAVTGNANNVLRRASAILADAVTLLSNNWSDIVSFTAPNNPAGRPAANTSYRMAIAAGKTLSFKKPTWAGAAQDFGTDGGVHNFLRYLERWTTAGGAQQTLNYRGSIVSLYISRQGVGTYKCCNNVYSPPIRDYTFDTDFLTPSLLPPGTPMFRDVDTLTFRQLLRPTE